VTFNPSGKVLYHGTRAWNIYWHPGGPSGWGVFDGHLSSFVGDMSGSGYYGNLTQYYQWNGSGYDQIQNSSVLEGTSDDSDPYPRAGSGSFLTPTDAFTEINKLVGTAQIPANSNWQYNLILGTNPATGSAENICTSTQKTECFTSTSPRVIGWHGETYAHDDRGVPRRLDRQRSRP
jgi:hypothetical protein